jgi:hypothetical protein
VFVRFKLRIGYALAHHSLRRSARTVTRKPSCRSVCTTAARAILKPRQCHSVARAGHSRAGPGVPVPVTARGRGQVNSERLVTARRHWPVDTRHCAASLRVRPSPVRTGVHTPAASGSTGTLPVPGRGGETPSPTRSSSFQAAPRPPAAKPTRWARGMPFAGQPRRQPGGFPVESS